MPDKEIDLEDLFYTEDDVKSGVKREYHPNQRIGEELDKRKKRAGSKIVQSSDPIASASNSHEDLEIEVYENGIARLTDIISHLTGRSNELLLYFNEPTSSDPEYYSFGQDKVEAVEKYLDQMSERAADLHIQRSDLDVSTPDCFPVK